MKLTSLAVKLINFRRSKIKAPNSPAFPHILDIYTIYRINVLQSLQSMNLTPSAPTAWQASPLYINLGICIWHDMATSKANQVYKQQKFICQPRVLSCVFSQKFITTLPKGAPAAGKFHRLTSTR